MNTNTKNDVITTFHANGNKHTEETYKNGKLDGIFTAWHKNGQFECEWTNKNGKTDGLVISYCSATITLSGRRQLS